MPVWTSPRWKLFPWRGPDLFNREHPAIIRYYEQLTRKLPLCVGLVLADRREAQMLVGEVEAHQMNFVKRYCHTTAQGEIKYFGDNFGTPVYDETTRHVTQANHIVNRSKMPETWPMELNAITLGDLAIVTAPNELFDTLFDTLFVYVEDHAPYGKVLTFGYCNDSRGYIPSKLGFEYGCYEADCRRFLPGIGEIIRDTFLEMLTDLKTTAQ